MTEITQADYDATEELWNEVDLCTCDRCHVFTAETFARHRKYGYDQGYYDGRQLDRLEERAAIVAWLRSGQFEDLDGHDIAEEIEAGAHTNYHPPSTRRQP